MSPVKALHELDTMYRVYMKDKRKGLRLSKVVVMNKTQEKILKAIDKNLLKVQDAT